MALGANFTTFSNTQANTKALARPRLFAQLNHFQDKAATWIVAAGGYGKTTLAVSYAASQNKSLIWLLIPEARSEERRVGKESRSRWWTGESQDKNKGI